MNIPTIGGTRGIFEIFVPGVFLLLNIGAVLFSIPTLDDHTKNMLASLASNSVLDVIVSICFGYLIGILLRLLKTDALDKLSAWWLRTFDKNAREKNHQAGKPTYRLFATEGFPYIGWVGEVAAGYLPPEAFHFYNQVWAKRKRDSNQNKQFFNFCKLVVSSNDEHVSDEIYAVEALTRYIAGMFYALLLASIMIIVTIALHIAIGEWVIGFFILLAAYLLAIIIIVQRFRKIRIKEVEAVFAASYKNRELFEEKKTKAKK
ncbi:MAG: hypothetical protein IPP66_22590 [Anaerolineales bacterium]|nr:hypothetical protein [Anaerolineales bacterium]